MSEAGDVEHGYLVVRRRWLTGVRRIQPMGRPVRECLPVPGSDSVVLLGDWANAGEPRWRPNLICVRLDGHQEWAVDYGLERDLFSTIRWKGAGLQGYTWNGYLVEIDPKTADTLSRQFAH